ncbi:MAG TPA: hypothetical protein VM120_13260 [Bryobacteraceae bacterium]|nr:hypothetical protein [Bryobacteraceae bacterium]
MSISEAHAAAARQNGAQSKGPTTPEGKAHSSQNARKHGLSCACIRVNPEEQPHFDTFYNSLVQELNPAGPIEQHLFEELTHAAWTLEKIRHYRAVLSDLLDSEDQPTRDKHDRYARYHSRAQATWFRCYNKLKAVQSERLTKQTQADTENMSQWVDHQKGQAYASLEAESPVPEPNPADPPNIFQDIVELAATLDPKNAGHLARISALYDARVSEFLTSEMQKLKE